MKPITFHLLATSLLLLFPSCSWEPSPPNTQADDYFYFSKNHSDLDVTLEDAARRSAQKMGCMDYSVFLYGNTPRGRTKSTVNKRLNEIKDILVQSGIEEARITTGTALPTTSPPADSGSLYSQEYVRAIYTTQQ